MKELYMAAHDELIANWLEDHPEASEEEAYEATADRAYYRMKDKYADLVDQAKQKLKDEGKWPPNRKQPT